MTDFKAKMHLFDFGWGSAPDLAGGAYRPPSWIWGSLCGRRGAGLGRRRERGVKGREREGPQVTVEPGPLRALLRH